MGGDTVVFESQIGVLVGQEANYAELPPPEEFKGVLVQAGAKLKRNAETIKRDNVRTSFSTSGSITGIKSATLTLPIEIKGGGIIEGSLQKPEIDWILESCGLKGETGIWFRCENLIGNFEFKESLKRDGQSATAAFCEGNQELTSGFDLQDTPAFCEGIQDLASGFDWGTTNQDFEISVNGGINTAIVLNTLTTDVVTTRGEINAELIAAGLAGIEAYDVGSNHIGLRTTAAGSTQSIVLSAGVTDALTTLGLTPGTYTGITKSKDFNINVNNAGSTTVTLNLTTTDFVTTIAAVNVALSNASVIGVEAYDANSGHIGFRTTATGFTQSIVLSTGVTNALEILGLMAGTYNGTDATPEAVVGSIINSSVDATNVQLWTNMDALGGYSSGDTFTGIKSGATCSLLEYKKTFLYGFRTLNEEVGSNTFYFHTSKIRHLSTGTRGNVSLKFEAGKIGVAEFEVQGTYSEPLDFPLPDVEVSEIVPPLCCSTDLQIGTLDMSKINISKLDIQFGNAVSQRTSMGRPGCIIGFAITKREPKISFDPEQTALVDHNPYYLADNNVYQKIQATFGHTDGNRFMVVMHRVQIEELGNDSAREGIATYEISASINGDKDDEFHIIFS